MDSTSRKVNLARITAIAILLSALAAADNKCSASDGANTSDQEIDRNSTTIEWKPNPAFSGTVIPKSITHQTMRNLGIAEYKPKTVIALKCSQSRVFQIEHRVARTSISDPLMAEPVVVSQNQFVLIGKKPGTATLAVWDDVNNVEVFELHVEKNDSQLADKNNSAKAIPSMKTDNLGLEECKTIRIVHLEVGNLKLFNLKNRIVRTSISNATVAQLSLPAQNQVRIAAQLPGSATIFLWDEVGGLEGIDLRVDAKVIPPAASKTGKSDAISERATFSSTEPEIEIWTGSKKDIVSPPTASSL